MVVQAFSNLGTTNPITFSSYNHTSRYYRPDTAPGTTVQVGDAPGAATVSFTETASVSNGFWASVAVPMYP
jgi:hypothetical protein